MAIEELRQQIDRLDTELVELLAKRQAVTAEVGRYKKDVGKPIYDPARESELIGKRRQLADSLGLSPELIEDLLRRIMRESYQSQHNTYRCIKPNAKIVIVGGRGALGQRFKEMFERSGYQVKTLDQDDWPDAEALVSGAQLVLVAVPIERTVEIIAKLPALNADCILADLTSLKEKPIAAMLAQHPGPVVGLHPMFGPDVPNFVKQVVVACHGRGRAKYQWLLQQIALWGAVLQQDDAKAHDKSMQLIQAMRHFTTYVYGRFLSQQNADLNQLLRLSSPIYRLELAMTGRLFAQNSRLYADIIYGAEQAQGMAQAFLQELELAIDDLANGDKDAFSTKFAEVATWFGEKAQIFQKDSRALLQSAQDARDVE